MSYNPSGDVLIGIDYEKWHKSQQQEPIYWRESAISNAHVGVAGTSGSGKTHWIREFVSHMPEGVEVDIFDYHDDIRVDGAGEVLFSSSNRYGFNPLVLNPDPHYGGVTRCIKDVIEAINSTSRQLGPQQERVLTNLLTDVFALRGVYERDPRTWVKREASDEELEQMRAERKWSDINQCYPTLRDVANFATRKLKALWLGFEDRKEGQQALNAFDDYTKTVVALQRARTNAAKARAEVEGDEGLLTKLADAKEKAMTAYHNFLSTMETGREFDEVMKYNSKEVLLSVIGRLENLISTGLFTPRTPPFGNARIRRYRIKPLAQSPDELKMFVRFRLHALIRKLMQQGETPGHRLRHFVVLDESKKFNSEDADNPINVWVNEMRKFGGAIMLAGQSPEHFSSDFIKNAGTLLLLNLATADWDGAARKLKIDPKALRFLQPRSTAAVRMLEIGRPAEFRAVQLVASPNAANNGAAA
ncbi:MULTISPECIES: hypothetical protein [unclassified Burkholderia]|uniref:hypothetical protein n=1 Tax=unclassified Burkholderia TaxID=2613784 RepID=UPI002AB2FA15|nr:MULTISPECIES: hypothetical protein [unclassified Burkholderia]